MGQPAGLFFLLFGRGIPKLPIDMRSRSFGSSFFWLGLTLGVSVVAFGAYGFLQRDKCKKVHSRAVPFFLWYAFSE